ncbi:MAG TPA: adenylate/guanylate cyclase domain-containing protein [Candidatus Nitrosotenuis sp.]|jgi:adenylate cyclase|nr:adenylate/guanylate cyclase domain-containing protein [Candidatus Nitrosotenuis sp.]
MRVGSREQVAALAFCLGLALLLNLAPIRTGLLGPLELQLYDLRLGLNAPPHDRRVRAFAIEEGDLGTWEARQPQVFATLAGGRCAAVLPLELLGQTSGPGLQALEPLRARGAVLLPLTPEQVEEGAAERLAQRYPGLRAGFFELEADPEDGLVRRVRLARPRAGSGRPSPAALLLAVAALEGVGEEEIEYGPGYIQVGSRRLITDREYRALVAFPPQRRDTQVAGEIALFPLPPVSRLYRPSEALMASLEGSAVLLGVVSHSATEEHFTPVGKLRTVEVAFAALDSLVCGWQVRQAPAWSGLALSCAFGLLLALVLPRLNSGVAALAGFAFTAGWIAANLLFLSRGLWLPLATPTLACLGSLAAVLLLQWVRSSRLLGHFLAPELASRAQAGEALALGGREEVCSVLFTALPACLHRSPDEPEQVLVRRNEFTRMAAEIYERHSGRAIDYQGDAQMILFGAPRKVDNHAFEAVAAALELRAAAADLAREWNLEVPEQGEVYSGICTGPVAVGFVGSEQHKEFSAIGDTTNVAARLLGQAKTLRVPVLVSRPTFEMARELVSFDELPPVRLKGKSQPVAVYAATALRVPDSAPR